jgi:regulator of replication initiation timing
MSLKSKLKQKDSVEEENEALRKEVAELRQRASEMERKKAKASDQTAEMQATIG